VSNSSTLLPAGLMAAYAVTLLLFARRQREQIGMGKRRWLMLTLLLALLNAAVYLLPDDAHTQADTKNFFIGELTQPALGVILTGLVFVAFTYHTLRYLQYRSAPLWTAAALIWWGAQAAATITTKDLSIGQDGWLGTIYDPVVWPGIVAIAGWAVIGALLLIAAFYAFFKAHLPEVANQALFYAIIVPLVLLGGVLGTSGSTGMREIGWVAEFFGRVGAVYSMIAYRVFDIRRTLRQTLATGILTLFTALIIFWVLLTGREMDTDGDTLYLMLGLFALAVALIYIPLRTVAQNIVNRLFGGPTEGVSQVLRQFSEDISGVVELDALADVTQRTLHQVLRARRAGLILVSPGDDSTLQLEPVRRGLGEVPDHGVIFPDGPIFERLLKARAPLLQYDLDFGRTYASIKSEQRQFFEQMRMSAYAPVVVQNELIGIVCCGSKTSDDPFTNSDLELLMTVANQTGVALRNARLVADLRRREMEQAELNRRLSNTSDQLAQLDGVKTDFITIASHELRTPLAQIRGYTDIMEAMNEQGLLEQDQIESMTGNLRKAADRLENLIGAMLDVSQLNVNAMDLRFAQTSIENVMRMAIEPLTESVKNRKLMLSARGLRNLPPIQADMQRLVQAFRNVVLNAIKYTPDGGRIDISGYMKDNEIIVEVRDSGIGIDRAHQQLIFEKFFRVQDPSLHSTGTTKFMGAGPGLGLTIAKGVVEGHGGRIWVESEGQDPQRMPGSTFFIALPLTPPAEAKRVLPFEQGSKQMENFMRSQNPDAPNGEPEATLLKPPPGMRG